MNDKLKALLKAMGFNDAEIAKYSETDAEKLKDLKPEEDAGAFITKVKDVYKNELEPQIKKEAQAGARKHLYTELEDLLAKEGGFKREDVGADAKMENFVAHFKTILSKKTEGEGGNKKLSEMQEELRIANEKIQTLTGEVEQAKTSSQKEIENFKTGMKRDNYLLETIGKLDKKTIAKPTQVLKLIFPTLEEKYAIVPLPNGEFDIRSKENPEIKVSKSSTEYLTLAEAMRNLIQEDNLFIESNGDEGKKKDEFIDKGKDGGKTDPKAKISSTSASVAEENEKIFGGAQ